MPKFIDKTGSVFGRLTVTSLAGKIPGDRRYYWNCVCTCGKELCVEAGRLSSGTTKSCGCLQRETATKTLKSIDNRTHGATRTPEYNSWQGMWARCTVPTDVGYERYKDKTPPEEWRDFEVFLKDMGPRPEGTTLDRIKNDLPYSKENCRWATKQEQDDNKKNTVFITHEGQTKSRSQWAKIYGLNVATIDRRQRSGKVGADLFLPPSK